MQYVMFRFDSAHHATQQMNEKAALGWRFVAMTDTNDCGYIVMKRGEE